NSILRRVVRTAADPARARRGFESLAAALGVSKVTSLPQEHARILAALSSGSQAMGVLLLQHPDWADTVLDPENLAQSRRVEGLAREVHSWLEPALQAKDSATAFAKLRQYKQREMLRIGARDLARLADAPQITREISDVADVCLDATLRLCSQSLVERL